MAENFKSLASYLTSLGLGELFTVDSKGNPGGFLYEQMQSGVETAAELKIALEGNETFRKRYKVIFDMRERANKGETVATPTVEDVRDYEVNYARRMAQYGVPASFYDSFEDAHKALATNLTIDQITDRIDSSYKIIKTLPQEVKDTFNEYYGDMAGEQGLLMAILDPTKANDVFEKSTRAAAFGGFGKKQNITFSREQSEDYAALGKDVSSAAGDVANVANLSSLASSNLGESGSDLASDVAFKAGALNNVEAQRQLQDRLLGRKVRQSDTTGGALITTKGVVGA